MSPDFTTFQKDDLRLLTRPCVYLFMWHGKPLYIGSSVNGIIRFGDPHHNQKLLRDVAEEIEVRWCASECEARRLEIELIKALNPAHNAFYGRRSTVPCDCPLCGNNAAVVAELVQEVRACLLRGEAA